MLVKVLFVSLLTLALFGCSGKFPCNEVDTEILHQANKIEIRDHRFNRTIESKSLNSQNTELVIIEDKNKIDSYIENISSQKWHWNSIVGTDGYGKYVISFYNGSKKISWYSVDKYFLSTEGCGQTVYSNDPENKLLKIVIREFEERR